MIEAGLDLEVVLNERDPTRLQLYQEIEIAARILRDRRDHNLAVEIANQVGKTFSA